MKNWLIRTKNNHVLGPVSIHKIQELIKNGSIKADDEVCSGNGYWFFIKEAELVEKYILNGLKQDFNPISEAQDVISIEKNEDGDSVPSEADLEYPDMDDLSLDDDQGNDSVEIGSLSDSDVELPGEAELEDNVVELAHITKEQAETVAALEEEITKIQQKLKPKSDNIDLEAPVHPSDLKRKLAAPKLPAQVSRKPVLSLNVILSCIFAFLLMLAVALYFRVHIIEFLKSSVDKVEIIPKAYAQNTESLIQKKNYLSSLV